MKKILSICILLLLISSCSTRGKITSIDPNESVYNTENLNSHDIERVVQELLDDMLEDMREITRNRPTYIIFKGIKVTRSVTEQVPIDLIKAHIEHQLTREKYINLVDVKRFQENNIDEQYEIDGKIILNTVEEVKQFSKNYNVILYLTDRKTQVKKPYMSNKVGKNIPK